MIPANEPSMKNTILGFILFLSVPALSKTEPLTYSDLRPRLLLHAEENLFAVDLYPEIGARPSGESVPLMLTKYKQKGIFKDRYYRVSLSGSFDAFSDRAMTKSDKVYTITLEELGANLQPTGVSLNLGAKANPDITVENFTQIRDQLSDNPTLKTGRTQVGDSVINSLPTILNNTRFPAYTKFDVIGVSDEYIPFTLSFRYTLKLREVTTKKIYTLAAPGLRELPIWAHIVAPQNVRMFEIFGLKAYY